MPTTQMMHYDAGLNAYAKVLARNASDAEDLVQETYVRAIRAMGRTQEAINMKSWLFTILRNVWRNQLRQRRNGFQFIENGVDETDTYTAVEPSKSPYALYEEKMEREELQRAILSLSVPLREIILMREYQELSYQEIATILNCPVGTVMSRLARARSKLRISLASMHEQRASYRPELTH
ncbi:RNA polymerase, sigma-24 subunit, ECF subfamily [Terriglobus saanensis SP1PR4]|uniref:RNA polymerase sigma factor n=2 Tax=Terriglobus saanensis TaxID=870903 RepID=E8UYU4_TERSS|nr:RNA polymerase, sigma-24 subunit, ECF subfamily [Terriglobus saanensis SP1PR4]